MTNSEKNMEHLIKKHEKSITTLRAMQGIEDAIDLEKKTLNQNRAALYEERVKHLRSMEVLKMELERLKEEYMKIQTGSTPLTNKHSWYRGVKMFLKSLKK